MKKKMVISLLLFLNILSVEPLQSQLPSQPFQKEDNPIQWGDVTGAVLLVGLGATLAYWQLPRLAGQTVEYDSPVFTKIGASILFAFGLTAGAAGATQLALMMRDRLNRVY